MTAPWRLPGESTDTPAADTCKACFGRGKRLHGWAVCPGPCKDCGGTGIASTVGLEIAVRENEGISLDGVIEYHTWTYADGSIDLATRPTGSGASWSAPVELRGAR